MAFTANFNLDTAGAVYYAITTLEAPSITVAPGTAVLTSGGLGQLARVPTPDAYSTASVTVRGEDDAVEVRVPVGRRLSSTEHRHSAAVTGGTTPWYTATDRDISYSQADWAGSVTHRYILHLNAVSIPVESKTQFLTIHIKSRHSTARFLYHGCYHKVAVITCCQM